MTEQIAALDALIEAVTAGDRHRVNRTMAEIGYPSEAWPWDWMSRVDASFTGSLDSAKALHDALLPAYEWRLRVNMAWVWTAPSTIQGGDEIEDDNGVGVPARAWLLAILKAYRAGL